MRKLKLSKRNQWVEELNVAMVRLFGVWVKERPEFRNVAFRKAWAAFEVDLQKRLSLQFPEFKATSTPKPARQQKEESSCIN